MAFMTYTKLPRPKGRVTETWEVRGATGPLLGWVQWYAQWRRYTFVSCSSSRDGTHYVFDAACLRELADFCDAQTLKRKVARVRAKTVQLA